MSKENQLMSPVDFHSRLWKKKNPMEVNGAHQLIGYPHSS